MDREFQKRFADALKRGKLSAEDVEHFRPKVWGIKCRLADSKGRSLARRR